MDKEEHVRFILRNWRRSTLEYASQPDSHTAIEVDFDYWECFWKLLNSCVPVDESVDAETRKIINKLKKHIRDEVLDTLKASIHDELSAGRVFFRLLSLARANAKHIAAEYGIRPIPTSIPPVATDTDDNEPTILALIDEEALRALKDDAVSFSELEAFKEKDGTYRIRLVSAPNRVSSIPPPGPASGFCTKAEPDKDFGTIWCDSHLKRG